MSLGIEHVLMASKTMPIRNAAGETRAWSTAVFRNVPSAVLDRSVLGKGYDSCMAERGSVRCCCKEPVLERDVESVWARRAAAAEAQMPIAS